MNLKKHGWCYPNIKIIMNIMDTRMVVELPEDEAEVQTSKSIPLPTFLAPLFINEGQPRSAMVAFQSFVDEFFEAAPNSVKKYMQYIFNLLLVASGAESYNEQQVRVSQLGIKMEEIELNPIMMQWASTHFSSIKSLLGNMINGSKRNTCKTPATKQLNDPKTQQHKHCQDQQQLQKTRTC